MGFGLQLAWIADHKMASFLELEKLENADHRYDLKARPMPNAVYLTKSRYTAGSQCLRRLWLNVHEPIAWNEPESGSSEDIGLEIGRMAHLLFPGGVLVEEKPWEHAAAVTTYRCSDGRPLRPGNL